MDKMQNFVVGDIVTAPSPASSGTTIEVESKENFPNPSTFGAYNLVLWNKEGIPDTSNCEIVRVTSISVVNSTLTELTITRAQEGTTAKTITTSWRAYLSPTKKYFDDLKTYIDGLQLTKASGSDINTGTDDAKFVTSKAIADSWIETGWIPARETWTYASANSINVPSGATNKYSKGDKIRLKQGGDWKYFYITIVADTLLTITGGSDYTVASSAITDNFYSNSENPTGFVHWMNFIPTGMSSGGLTYTITTVFAAKFKILGNCCFFNASIRGTTSGSEYSSIFVTGIPGLTMTTTASEVLVRAADNGMALTFNRSSGANFQCTIYSKPNWTIGTNRDIGLSNYGFF